MDGFSKFAAIRSVPSKTYTGKSRGKSTNLKCGTDVEEVEAASVDAWMNH